jgi:hypothetical protein
VLSANVAAHISNIKANRRGSFLEALRLFKLQNPLDASLIEMFQHSRCGFNSIRLKRCPETLALSIKVG